MSLIGPRPLPIAYLDRFTPSQLKRHNVKPGITGLAQVSGKNLLKWREKFKYDGFYVRRTSFILDVYIVIKTIKIIFFPYNDYSLHEEEFKGL
jgi:lipopolysaccharide/colanic/teichoic acid biosynthesis glycosyltransferase